jgi:hypothetical protein
VFDPLRLLETLTEHRVRYVLIGGLAAAAHGSPAVTYDLDICYARDEPNLERLAAALSELGATLRGAPKDVPFLLDARTLAPGDHFTLDTEAGPFDILGTPSGAAGGFDALIRNAVETDFDGLTVYVAGMDDLIRMKEAAGRLKDQQALEHLYALRDEVDREGPATG